MTLQQFNQQYSSEYISNGEAANSAAFSGGLSDTPAATVKAQETPALKGRETGSNETASSNEISGNTEIASSNEISDNIETTSSNETASSNVTTGSNNTVGSNETAARNIGATRHSQPVWRALMFLMLKTALIALASILVFTFLFGIMRHKDPSMAPAIKDGDLVVFYRYNHGGYMTQETIMLEINGGKQVRRVVDIEGDVVDIAEGELIVNGALQQETDILSRTDRYAEGVDFPLTVPEGEVFVLGDHRTIADDSRIYGPVKIEDTLGRVITVIRRRSI